MQRSTFILILVLGLLPVWAEAADSPFNVDLFLGWGGCYRPQQWTPVEIGVSANLTEPFAGGFLLSAQQDGLNTMDISHGFVLTPDVPLHLPLVTKIDFAANKCAAAIVNDRGRTAWAREYDLWDFSSGSRMLTALNESDLFIGVVGQRKFNLFALPEHSLCQNGPALGKVYVKDKLPRMVPWDWTGFAALDLLILYDPDWNTLNEAQVRAIAQWVSNGGWLLLVLGAHPLPASHPLAQLLPFEPQPARQFTIPPHSLDTDWAQSDSPETLVAYPLLAKPQARLFRSETYATGQLLFGAGFVGFGRVGVLAFDPATLAEKSAPAAARFWAWRIQCILDHQPNPSIAPPANLAGNNHQDVFRPGLAARDRGIIFTGNNTARLDENYSNNQFAIGAAQAGANEVLEHLLSIIELRPLSIGWVILLLTLLAVLLGPVDYLVLKRLDRLPLTWLTAAFWIAIFSVGAYYGVQALRGGALQLRSVAVVDAVAGDTPWSTLYAGLYSPRSRSYQFDGLQKNQWWSGAAPAREMLYAYDRAGGTRAIPCVQYDGSNLLTSLPVNIWSMQCLLSEAPAEKLPIKAVVSRAAGQVSLNLLNLAPTPIRRGWLLLPNEQMIPFGSIAAGQSQLINKKPVHGNPWGEPPQMGAHNYSYDENPSPPPRESVFFAQGVLPRTDAMLAYLKQGAAVVCAEYDPAPPALTVKDHPCQYQHRLLVRLVVFPQDSKEIPNDPNQAAF